MVVGRTEPGECAPGVVSRAFQNIDELVVRVRRVARCEVEVPPTTDIVELRRPLCSIRILPRA